MAYSSDSWVCCLTVSTHSCSDTRAVKLRPDAVPEFVGEIYDLALNRPEHLHMITWAQLEGFTPMNHMPTANQSTPTGSPPSKPRKQPATSTPPGSPPI